MIQSRLGLLHFAYVLYVHTSHQHKDYARALLCVHNRGCVHAHAHARDDVRDASVRVSLPLAYELLVIFANLSQLLIKLQHE